MNVCSPRNMAIIRHTIPVTTNGASNLSTEKKTQIVSIFFAVQK